MSEFVSKATDETKKKRELKFQLFIDTYVHNNVGGWGAVILDRQDKKTIWCGSEEGIDTDNPFTFELLAVIKGLEQIYSFVPKEDHRYTSIELLTDSLYAVNLIREWLDVWSEDLNSRPYSELLLQINRLRTELNVKAKYGQKSNNEYMWAAEKLAKERVGSGLDVDNENNSNLNN